MRRKVSELASKVWTRLRRDGLYVASRYYVGALVHGVHYLVYDRRWDEFDSCRTSGAVTPAASELIGEAGPLEKARYQAMARLPLIWAIEALDINPSKFGFIDYGSGRGRLLLTAARFPFREVIGIEFSRVLHRQACDNIRNHPREHLACTEIASLHANALDFEFPEGDWIAFLFNPFTEDVLRRVAQRIVEYTRASRGRIYVVFANSDRLPVLRNIPGLKRIHPSGPHALLLKTLAPVPFEFFVVESEETQPTSSALPTERTTHQAKAST